jgi:hypothetical protein
MVRIRAIDYDTPKLERKEYLYYVEEWNGKNWLGIPITVGAIGEHIEGKYQEVITRPKLDEQTGEHIENILAGTRDRYYIPFSKTKVDEIIKQSAYSNKHNIRFVVKFATEDSIEELNMATRQNFNYDYFVAPWDQLYTHQYWPTSDKINRPNLGVGQGKTTATKLEFKPS